MSSPPQRQPEAKSARSVAIVDGQVSVAGELRRLDIGIVDGVIVELAQSLSGTYPRSIDAQGLIALPGLIETAPLQDLEAASPAAVRSGVTTLFAVAPASTRWETAVTEWEDRCHVDFAVFVQAQPGQAQGLRDLEGQLGFAGPWLGLAGAPLDHAELQALLRCGRLRVAAHLSPQEQLLPLLDEVMQALRPVHLLSLHSAAQLSDLQRHPARRLTTAAVAVGKLLDTDPSGEAELLLQALRTGDATLLTSGIGPAQSQATDLAILSEWLPRMLDCVADSQLSLPEVEQWCAQKPAQAFQLQGKGGLLPGLDGDVVLIDPRRPPAPQSAVAMTISRGLTVWAGGEESQERRGSAVRLARPLAILPR